MIDIQQNSPIELLQNLGFWQSGEKISQISVPGESNMNLVLRIETNQGSYILKQAKSYVRKYPQISAPIHRIEIEYQFLKQLAGNSFLASQSPKVLQYDAQNYLMLLEDLGEGSDFLSLYGGHRQLKNEEVKHLVDYLLQLHQLEITNFPATGAMRTLNHEHIFNFPFLEENGVDLDTIQPGLQEVSLPYKTDLSLKHVIQALGNRYLADGKVLVHGDYYPGSWLQVSSGIKIIDPEFGGLGEAEFDLGVFLAHLDLSEQAEDLSAQVQKQYSLPVDWSLVQQYRGVEILRRLIGIAQLPVSLSLDAKKSLLARARTYVMSLMKKLALIFIAIVSFSCAQQEKEATSTAFSKDIRTEFGLTEAELYDKILGMLVGSSIGDAMGAPTEMWTREAIQLEYGFVEGLDSMVREVSPEGIWKANLPAGGTTDDTRWKSLAVDFLLGQKAESLESKDFASHILKTYEGSLAKLKSTEGTDVEPFENALQEANWLSEWSKVATPYLEKNIDGYADSLSKFYGGEMVCAGLLYAPTLGAFFPGNPLKAYQEAYKLSIFDLGYARDLTALAAAMTAAGMAPKASQDSILATLRLDPEGYFQSRLVGRTSHKLLKDALTIVREAKKLDSLPTKLSLGNPALKYAYTELDRRQQDMPFHAGEIYLQALTAMLFTDFDLMGTLTFLTNYGRDNDTTGSLAGGILGAWYGYAKLPVSEREKVVRVTRDELGIDLEKQAERLTLHLLKSQKN